MQANRPLNKNNIRRLLLIQLGDIGDVVLTFPCVRALRENFPNARIVMAVRKKAAQLVEGCPWADGVIAIRKDKRRCLEGISCQRDFFLHLRRSHFDLAIDMRTGDRGAILAMLSGAPQRVGYHDYKGNLWRNRLFTHRAFCQYEFPEHVTAYHLKLLKAFDMEVSHPRPEMTISSKRLFEAEKLLGENGVPPDGPVVALQPFSLWGYKEWGIEKYARLIEKIHSEFHIPVVLIGSPDEKKRAKAIITECRERAYDLVGETTMSLLPAVLKICRLFIGLDSAGQHIAAAVGTPTLGIYGPSSPASWAPRGDRHSVIQKKWPCVPCRQKGCRDTGISRCLDELDVDEIFPAVRQVLSIPQDTE